MIGRWLALWRARRVRDTSAAYLTPEYVRLLEEADLPPPQLGGMTKDATVLVCTLNGLDTGTAALKDDPPAVVRMMNRILTPLTDIIMSADGCVETCSGDRLSAFWNAPIEVPDHAAKACTAALAMVVAIEALNDKLHGEIGVGGAVSPRLALSIGLNSGSVVVGNIGSLRRMHYTAVGDAVVLTNNFSGAARHYGVSVLIGETLQRRIANFATLEIDVVMIKGRSGFERVHTVLGTPELAADPEFRALRHRHQQMLVAQGDRRWNEAAALLAECRGNQRWGLDRVYDLYADRIAKRSTWPP